MIPFEFSLTELYKQPRLYARTLARCQFIRTEVEVQEGTLSSLPRVSAVQFSKDNLEWLSLPPKQHDWVKTARMHYQGCRCLMEDSFYMYDTKCPHCLYT